MRPRSTTSRRTVDVVRENRYVRQMPLLGLTNVQAKYAKWLVRAAEYALPAGVSWLTSLLDASGSAGTDLEWRRYVFKLSRSTPAATVEDIAQFKFDLLNVTNDEVDNTWTTTDYGNVGGPQGTLRTNLLPF